jgi:hypothetical protein
MKSEIAHLTMINFYFPRSRYIWPELPTKDLQAAGGFMANYHRLSGLVP